MESVRSSFVGQCTWGKKEKYQVHQTEKELDQHMCFSLVQKTTTGEPVFEHKQDPKTPVIPLAWSDLRCCANVTKLLRLRPGQLEQIKEVLEQDEG